MIILNRWQMCAIYGFMLLLVHISTNGFKTNAPLFSVAPLASLILMTFGTTMAFKKKLGTAGSFAAIGKFKFLYNFFAKLSSIFSIWSLLLGIVATAHHFCSSFAFYFVISILLVDFCFSCKKSLETVGDCYGNLFDWFALLLHRRLVSIRSIPCFWHQLGFANDFRDNCCCGFFMEIWCQRSTNSRC